MTQATSDASIVRCGQLVTQAACHSVLQAAWDAGPVQAARGAGGLGCRHSCGFFAGAKKHFTSIASWVRTLTVAASSRVAGRLRLLSTAAYSGRSAALVRLLRGWRVGDAELEKPWKGGAREAVERRNSRSLPLGRHGNACGWALCLASRERTLALTLDNVSNKLSQESAG